MISRAIILAISLTATTAFATVATHGSQATSGGWLLDAQDTSAHIVQRLRGVNLWIGGAVGVYDSGAISEKAYGETVPGSSATPPIDAAYEIGSITKSFTGILLALALEDHPNLSVDDTLAKFLPEIKNSYVQSITLRELATHSAGLPDDPSNLFTSPNYDPANAYGNYDEEQLFSFLQTAQPVPALKDPKHTGYYLRSYSNVGFATLGLVLTRIYGTSFDNLLKGKITGPLNMLHTFVDRKGVTLPPDMMTPFGVAKNQVNYMPMDIYAPTGAIVSTIPDMMIYLRVNIDPPDNELGHAINVSHQLGFGWDSLPGDEIVWKNGQTTGFSALIAFDPPKHRGTIVLHDMCSALTDWVAAVPVEDPTPTADSIYKYFRLKNFELATVPLSASILETAPGSYIGSPNQDIPELTLATGKSSLVVMYKNDPIGLVMPRAGAGDPYWIYQGGIQLGTLSFEQTPSGEITGFTFHEMNVSGTVVATDQFVRQDSALK